MALLRTVVLLAFAVVVPAAVAGALGSEEALDLATLESQVRATETAFAKTMADRDHAAFVTFLAPEAVFFGSDGPTRGAVAVATAWKGYFEAREAPFSWAPEEVAVLAGGDLALSSGPVHAPNGSRVGTFTSVWRRQSDGSWKIVLDKGCPPCRCGGEGP